MKGIVLTGPDRTIQGRAERAKLPVVIDPALPFAFDQTLFVVEGTQVPWDLLPAAWHFLERWDAAVPLWRYGVTAADIGTKEERVATQLVVRDLRVLLHSYELLFVRQNEFGCELVETWKHEYSAGGDKRLAFLRAFYQVKPRLCVLPISWLADVSENSRQALASSTRRNDWNPGPLVKVELEPGRFVKCHPGDEEKVREHFERQRTGRH